MTRSTRAGLLFTAVTYGAAALGTLTAAKVDRTASLIVTPYLGWLGFATYLNAGVVAANS